MPIKKIKVLVLFGTRPELIKLSSVIKQLGKDDRFATCIVSTSQHRKMIDGLLGSFGIQPDHDLDIIQSDQSLADISVRVLQGLEPVLASFEPDMMLVQGDTSSAFVGALAAFYHKIPVGHVEAGLRSFDRDHPYPEEINRRLVSVVSTLHFAPMESNKSNLLKDNIESRSIFVTGNTVIDALAATCADDRSVLGQYLDTAILTDKRMVLVTAHRRESFDEYLAELCHAIKELVLKYPDIVVLYPLHLNPNVRAAVRPILGGLERVLLLEPLPYQAFVEAMAGAYLIVTDSGGVQEEAPWLGKPVLVFRKVTERNEGVEASGAKVVGLDRSRLVEEAEHLLNDEHAYQLMAKRRMIYGDGRSAERIVSAILHEYGMGKRPDDYQPGDYPLVVEA